MQRIMRREKVHRFLKDLTFSFASNSLKIRGHFASVFSTPCLNHISDQPVLFAGGGRESMQRIMRKRRSTVFSRTICFHQLATVLHRASVL
jgi:hypothetical protein